MKTAGTAPAAVSRGGPVQRITAATAQAGQVP
jgi:hypothetical protein